MVCVVVGWVGWVGEHHTKGLMGRCGVVDELEKNEYVHLARVLLLQGLHQLEDLFLLLGGRFQPADDGIGLLQELAFELLFFLGKGGMDGWMTV